MPTYQQGPDRPSLIKRRAHADNPHLRVGGEPRLAFQDAPALRPAHAVLERIGDPVGLAQDRRRTGRQLAGPAGLAGGEPRLGLGGRRRLGRQMEKGEGAHECEGGDNQNALQRFVSRCEQIPDTWSYIVTLSIVFGFIVYADNVAELRASSRVADIQAEQVRRAAVFERLPSCNQSTVLDVMGAPNYSLQAGPDGRQLVTVDHPVANPCAFNGMALDRRRETLSPFAARTAGAEAAL